MRRSGRFPIVLRGARVQSLEALGRFTLVAEDHIPVRLKLMEGGVEVGHTASSAPTRTSLSNSAIFEFTSSGSTERFADAPRIDRARAFLYLAELYTRSEMSRRPSNR